MKTNKAQIPFLLAVLFIIFVVTFFLFEPFLGTLTFAAIFSVVIYPIYKKVLKAVGGRESIAAFLTTVFSVVCVLIPLIFLGTQLVKESIQLYGSFSQMDDRQNGLVIAINDMGKASESIIPGTEQYFINFANDITLYIRQGLEWLVGNLDMAITGFSKLMLDLLIFFIVFYYLLKDGTKLKRAIIKLSPLDNEDDETVFKKLESAVNSIIKGNLVIAFIQGILMAVGFTMFGVPNAILWGSVTILASLIPRVGTAIILVPAVVYLFVTGSTISGVGLILWGTFVVGLVDNILGPKLIGRELELHPVFVLLSALGGLVLFGPVGIFLGPLTVSLLFAFLSVYSHMSSQ